MFLLYVNTEFLIPYLEYKDNHPKANYFDCVFYFRGLFGLTNCFNTDVMTSLKFSFNETFFMWKPIHSYNSVHFY